MLGQLGGRTSFDTQAQHAGRPSTIGPARHGHVVQWSGTRTGRPRGLAAAGATAAATTDIGRSAAVLLAAIPKPARLGREAFANQLGRVLAGRGVLVVDRSGRCGCWIASTAC